MQIKKFIQSCRNAAKGVRFVYRNEQNFRIQLALAILVVALMFVFSLSKSEMVAILMLILLILILELLNSALEKFVDILKPRLEYQVEVVKDIMAAMVLIASLGAIIIGGIIFWPHVFNLSS